MTQNCTGFFNTFMPIFFYNMKRMTFPIKNTTPFLSSSSSLLIIMLTETRKEGGFCSFLLKTNCIQVNLLLQCFLIM